MPVIMKDNFQYAYTTKGTVFHTLSNAEYEALPESEKMNGDVYCIPDREPILNPDQLWEKVGTETLDIGDDLTDGVNQLNSSLSTKSNNLLVEYKTISLSYASETNPVASGNFNASKSGYTALGIVGYQVAGVSSSICFVPSMIINSSGTISYTVRATSGGTYSHTLYVYVLYVKN